MVKSCLKVDWVGEPGCTWEWFGLVDYNKVRLVYFIKCLHGQKDVWSQNNCVGLNPIFVCEKKYLRVSSVKSEGLSFRHLVWLADYLAIAGLLSYFDSVVILFNCVVI